jgi:TolB protein
MTIKPIKLCIFCGKSYPTQETVCPHCGREAPAARQGAARLAEARLPLHEQPTEGTSVSESPEEPAETPARRWTLGRAIGGCLLAFTCVLIIFLAIGGVAAYQGLQERAALTLQEASVHYERGLAHLQAGEYELAIAEFEHTLRLNPAHREAREALRNAKTVALAQPTPTSATLHEARIAILAEAEALGQEGKWPEAIQRLSQLRDLAPEFEAQQVADLLYTAYINLGAQQVKAGQVDEAVHAFEQALAERPDDAEASRQLDRASLYVSAQATWGAEWASTIDFLEQLYTLDPGYLDTQDKLFQAYEAYGDALNDEEAWCLAEVQYQQAALITPNRAIQAKSREAGRLCRMPTATPRPTGTRVAPIPATGTSTATPVSTATTYSASGSILFSRFNIKDMRWEIVAVTPSRGDLAVVLQDATQPAASPNGQLLAYHAETDESEGLHVQSMAAGNDVRVTTFREDVTPDWAPDNLRFVFPSQRAGDRRWQIFIAWADAKGEPVALVEGRTPAWSPDGKLIAYQGSDPQGNNPGLYLIRPEGGSTARLTQGESDRAPAWSPDCARGSISLTETGISATPASGAAGNRCRIAFMSSQGGNWEIYIADVSSGAVTPLTTSPGNDGLPVWSPDGKYIAFVSDRGGSWGVYIMPGTGGAAAKVADWGEEHSDWLVERIAWAR